MTPELYCLVLQNLVQQTAVTEYHSPPIDPTLLSSAPFPSHPDRVNKVLDAFASICIHEPLGQVVALSASLTREKAILSISGNTDVGPKVETHLRDVWRRIGEISHSLAPISDVYEQKGSPPRRNGPRTESLSRELRIAVYGFCYSKLGHCLDKQKAELKQFANWLKDSKKPDPAHTIASFIRGALAIFSKSPSEENVKTIATQFHAFSVLCGKKLKDFDSEYFALEREYARKFGVLWLKGVAYAFSLESQKAFRVCHRLSKLLSLDHHLQTIIDFARSARFAPYFKNPLQIVPAPSPALDPLRLDVSSEAIERCIDDCLEIPDSKFTADASKEIKDILMAKLHLKIASRPFDVTVHAELNIIAEHPTIQPYNYIGVSKLCCFLCYAAIEAYRQIAERANLLQFYTRGTHGKVYPGWAVPNLFPKDPESQTALCNGLVKHVKAEIINVGKRMRERARSDSSAASAESEKQLTVDERQYLGEHQILH
jgi:hypothetical protein